MFLKNVKRDGKKNAYTYACILTCMYACKQANKRENKTHKTLNCFRKTFVLKTDPCLQLLRELFFFSYDAKFELNAARSHTCNLYPLRFVTFVLLEWICECIRSLPRAPSLNICVIYGTMYVWYRDEPERRKGEKRKRKKGFCLSTRCWTTLHICTWLDAVYWP